jgi:hypothetical protein
MSKIVKRDEETNYPLLKPAAMKQMLGVYQDNIGPYQISSFELPRIKCPAAGSTVWKLDTPDGDEILRELEAIILSWRQARAYWKISLNDGGSQKPPDCSSKDGFFGVGDPGGRCGDCPLAQFGSSTRGGRRGQACKQMRQMLILRPGESVPYFLSVPPTSLRACVQYFLGLASRGVSHWETVTKIRLEKTKNADGTEYSRMIFIAGPRLTGQEQDLMRPYRERMQALLAPIEVVATDYSVVAPSPAEEAEATEEQIGPDDDIPY